MPNLKNSFADADEELAELRRAAVEYHEFPVPGKIAIEATKQTVDQRDLSLAYSPGLAAPCEEIVKDPFNAFKYTEAKGRPRLRGGLSIAGRARSDGLVSRTGSA